MRPTRVRILLATALACGLLTERIVSSTYDQLPQLPFGAVATLTLIAVAEGYLAVATRNRLAGRPGTKPVDPLVVARYVALAKASSPVGAGFAGAWAGVLVVLAGKNGALAAIGHDRVVATAGVLAGVILTLAAARLEWVCRLPKPPPEGRNAPPVDDV